MGLKIIKEKVILGEKSILKYVDHILCNYTRSVKM